MLWMSSLMMQHQDWQQQGSHCSICIDSPIARCATCVKQLHHSHACAVAMYNQSHTFNEHLIVQNSRVTRLCHLLPCQQIANKQTKCLGSRLENTLLQISRAARRWLCQCAGPEGQLVPTREANFPTSLQNAVTAQACWRCVLGCCVDTARRDYRRRHSDIQTCC